MEEAELYRDLVEDTFGPSVRLEQERFTCSAVERALLRDPASVRGPEVAERRGSCCEP
jgi:hypothetical protein